MKKKASSKNKKKTLKKTGSNKAGKKTLKKKSGTKASSKKTKMTKTTKVTDSANGITVSVNVEVNPQVEQTKPVGKKPEDETTEIICVIDRSTSIRTSGLIEKTIEGFNSFLAEQKKAPGKAKLTMCLFDGGSGYGAVAGKTYEIIHSGIDIKDVPELNTVSFNPRGMTAMYDAIGNTIDNVSKRIKEAKAEDRPDKVVFLIMTDGEENSSREYNQKTVFDLINKRKEEDKWAFIFIGANIDTMREGGSMGVSRGNMMSYSNTDRGVHTAYANLSVSVSKLRAKSSTSMDFVECSNSLISDNGVEKEDIAGNTTTTVGANSSSGTIGTANRFTTALDENGNGQN